jgi:hypothetical protein
VVKYAGELFEPYRPYVRILGTGNHEMKWAKWNGFDPTAALIELLNCDDDWPPIKHGGVSGWYRTRFRWGTSDRAPSVAHTLWYHHGSGGDAPVTKGAIEFSRMESRWQADCYTMGHKHWRSSAFGACGYLSPTDLPRRREHLLLQTGSYLLNHLDSSQDNPTHMMYAEEFNHPPKPMGGWFLRLRPEVTWTRAPSRCAKRSVKQDVLSCP